MRLNPRLTTRATSVLVAWFLVGISGACVPARLPSSPPVHAEASASAGASVEGPIGSVAPSASSSASATAALTEPFEPLSHHMTSKVDELLDQGDEAYGQGDNDTAAVAYAHAHELAPTLAAPLTGMARIALAKAGPSLEVGSPLKYIPSNELERMINAFP